MIALFGALALAGADPAELRADWVAFEGARRSAAVHAVALSDADLAKLAAGGVVRARERVTGGDRAWGAVWTALPVEPLWVAILDDQPDTLVRGLFEEQLPGTTTARKLLYQRLDLPWPFDDRQWVIDIQNNPQLYSATDTAIWERSWTLTDPSLAVSATPDAVWTPVNEGGWMLARAAGGTLLVYHVRTSVGGAIPDDLVTRYALSTLDELLGHVLERAASLGDHYGVAHQPFYRPDGAALPPYPASQTK